MVIINNVFFMLDHWNRVVVALGTAVPTSLGNPGFYEGRIFVGSNSEDHIYFGDFSSKPLFQDTANATIDICSTRVSGSSMRNSSVDGNYDMMNFAWFRGEFGDPWIDVSGKFEFFVFFSSFSCLMPPIPAY